jgi:hypothetical protein
MRRRLSDFCTAIQFISCDAEQSYFVDYSKSTDKLRGAEFNCDTTDLPGLLIKNQLTEFSITAVIFDDHCFRKENSEEDLEHCEGVVFPEPYAEDNWNLFVELKYDKQLFGKPNKAFSQIVNTVSHLRSNATIPENKKVYGVVYFPVAGSKPPYSSSFFTHEEMRRLNKEEKLILTSTGSISVLSNKKLKFV